MRILVRIPTDPRPFTYLVLKECLSYDKKECFVLAEYGFNPNKTIMVLKTKCEILNKIPENIDIEGWLKRWPLDK